MLLRTLSFNIQIVGAKGEMEISGFPVFSLFHSIKGKCDTKFEIIVTLCCSKNRRRNKDRKTVWVRPIHVLLPTRKFRRRGIYPFILISTIHPNLSLYPQVQNRAPFETTIDDGIKNMMAIDAIYQKAGLVVRGT